MVCVKCLMERELSCLLTILINSITTVPSFKNLGSIPGNTNREWGGNKGREGKVANVLLAMGQLPLGATGLNLPGLMTWDRV